MAREIKKLNLDIPSRSDLLDQARNLDYGEKILNILNSFGKMKMQKGVNELKQKQSLDMATLQILSSQLAGKMNTVNQYESWLAKKGLYGQISESDQTSQGLDWVDELASMENADIGDLTQKMKTSLSEIEGVVDDYRQLESQYHRGMSKSADLAEQLGDLMKEDDYRDFQLSGVFAEGEFTPGSELEAIFNPDMINQRLNIIHETVLGPNVLDSKTGLDNYNKSQGTNFKTLEEIEKYYNEQTQMHQGLTERLSQEVIDITAKDFENQAFVAGFNEGKRISMTANRQL